MDYTKEYHLAINDFRIEESQGILFLGNELERETDVLNALKKPILRGSDFRHPWGQIFTPEENEAVLLRVYGSEFTKKLFIAYAQAKHILGVKFDYVEGMAGLELKLWDESFDSRFSRFLKLKDKYSLGSDECRNVSVLLVCNCAGEKAAILAGKIKQTFENYRRLFNLSFSCSVIKDEGVSSSTSMAICDDKSSDVFKIAISDCCKNEKFKSNPPTDRILFIIDEEGEDNVLEPRGSLDGNDRDDEVWYTWSFNNETVLVATIASYIESYLLAPLFTEMWRDFGEQKLHLMELSDRAEWYSLTRVFPFVVEEVPKDAVIGNEFNVNVLSFGCDLSGKDALTLEGCELASIDSDELTIVNNQIYIVQTVARCDEPAEIPCRNNIFLKNIGKCDYIQVAMDKNCKDTIVIHKYDCKTNECQNQIINVKNHSLTTHCDAFVNGVRFRGYPICMPIGGTYWLTSKPFNEFDPDREPDDLSECHWRYNGDEVMDISVGNVKIRKNALVAAPTERCLVKYEIYCGDRYLKSVSIDAVPRVERMEVKATILGETVGSTIGKVANIECFQGQKIDLSVAIHTSDNKLPMFIPGLKVVFPDCSEKIGENLTAMDLSVCFKNPGKRKIEVMALDDIANVKQVINFNIKEENSDKFLLCMFIGVLLAWLFFILNYGLGLWTFLSYLVPAVCYWRYKMKQCRFYRKIMMGLFIADIVMFIWSFIQEIA